MQSLELYGVSQEQGPLRLALPALKSPFAGTESGDAALPELLDLLLIQQAQMMTSSSAPHQRSPSTKVQMTIEGQ